MNIKWKWEGVGLVALLGVTLVTLFVYPQLPDPMPTHWNAAGQPDGYSSRVVGAWLLPGMTLLIYGLLLALPRMDPRRSNVERFQTTYALLRAGIILFMSFMQLIILYVAITGQDDLITLMIPLGVGLLFILIGNYLPRVRSNWFLGIRTPWTLSSERVWRETHRVGGRLFMLAGLLMLLTPLVPAAWRLWIILVVVLMGSLLPIAYSFWLFQNEQGKTG